MALHNDTSIGSFACLWVISFIIACESFQSDATIAVSDEEGGRLNKSAMMLVWLHLANAGPYHTFAIAHLGKNIQRTSKKSMPQICYNILELQFH